MTPRPLRKGVSEKWAAEVRAFAADLVLVKDRAARLKLWKTMHALDQATHAVGYEIEAIEEKP